MSLRCRFGIHQMLLKHHILPSGTRVLFLYECERCGGVEGWGIGDISSPGSVVEVSLN